MEALLLDAMGPAPVDGSSSHGLEERIVPHVVRALGDLGQSGHNHRGPPPSSTVENCVVVLLLYGYKEGSMGVAQHEDRERYGGVRYTEQSDMYETKGELSSHIR